MFFLYSYKACLSRLFIDDIILKDSVWTASYCNGYTACGGTSCTSETLANVLSKSSPPISSYYCGSGSYYCVVAIFDFKIYFS